MKRLHSIQNLGAVDVLCCAYMNSWYQTGLRYLLAVLPASRNTPLTTPKYPSGIYCNEAIQRFGMDLQCLA